MAPVKIVTDESHEMYYIWVLRLNQPQGPLHGKDQQARDTSFTHEGNFLFELVSTGLPNHTARIRSPTCFC